MRLLQYIVVLSSLRSLDAQLHAAALENFVPRTQGADSRGVQNDSSSHLLLPPSSPECWLDTLEELYQEDFRGNGQSPLDLTTCVKLDTHHQQALGLRLAKCHLATMGRFLAGNEDNSHDACNDLHHPNGVKKCLSSLSTNAETTYTLFFKDLHYMCTRLLQESVTNRYYQTTQELEQVSKMAETRLHEMLQHQEQYSLFWREKEERMAQWFQEQTQLSANQASEFQEQQQELHRHKKELQSLADAMQTTKASIQPWTQLVELSFRYVPMGYSVLKICASMLGTMLIISILTPHQHLGRTRLKLLVAVLYGGLGELVLLWLENQDEIELTAAERLEMSDCLKNFVMSFLVACYLSGLLSFCCGWNRGQQDDESNEAGEDAFHDQVGQFRRESELLECLRLQSYQQRMNAMTAHQLQQQQPVQTQARTPNADRQASHLQQPLSISTSLSAPTLIYSPESTAMASTLPVAWNTLPSPLASHGTLPVYASRNASGNLYNTCSHNDNESVRDTETIDLPPEEPDKEEEDTDECRNDSVSTTRKRACSEMEKTKGGEIDDKRDLSFPKKPRSGGRK